MENTDETMGNKEKFGARLLVRCMPLPTENSAWQVHIQLGTKGTKDGGYYVSATHMVPRDVVKMLTASLHDHSLSLRECSSSVYLEWPSELQSIHSGDCSIDRIKFLDAVMQKKPTLDGTFNIGDETEFTLFYEQTKEQLAKAVLQLEQDLIQSGEEPLDKVIKEFVESQTLDGKKKLMH